MRFPRPPVLPMLAGLVLPLLAAPAVAIQTVSVTYTLEDVWLDPDVSQPFLPPEQMTGTFVWTYVPGDFENGTATWLAIDIPWAHPAMNELVLTVDLDQIETTLVGNYQNYAADVQLRLATPLDPGHASPIDLANSSFTIENGPSYQGHVISGSVVPDTGLDLQVSGNCPTHTMTVDRVTPNGDVVLLHAGGVGALTVPLQFPCAGTPLGLDTSTALAVLLTADAAGTTTIIATLPPSVCGSTFLQALDLTACTTSQVVALL